jgi:hypothetical protein
LVQKLIKNKIKQMKKTILTLILTAMVAVGFGQGLWKDSKFFIDFGPKVSIGPSWFNNGTSSFYDTTANVYLHKFNSLRFNVGGKFAFDFNDNIAIVGEYLYTQNTQTYGVDGNNLQIKAVGSEIPLMFRYNLENDVYYEAGMVFVNTRSVTETLNGNTTDHTDLYNTRRKGLILGCGQYAFGIGNWGVSTGFRFRYNLGNAVNDGNSQTEGNPIYALDSRADITKDMSVMLVMEFNFDMGFTMAKSACGRSRKFLLQAR